MARALLCLPPKHSRHWCGEPEAFRVLPAMPWRQSRLSLAAVVLLALSASPAPAQAPGEDGLSPAAMQTGSLLLRMQEGYRLATRVNTDIDARITGPVARVRVRQEFRNDGDNWVEGVYVFPLPDTAAVDLLRMKIGERIIEAEIREKDEARKLFEDARDTGRKASLVEQQRANLFTTSVANIAPGEAVVVEIGYLETLRYDEGTFSLRIPLTMTPRYIPGQPLPDRRGSGWSADTAAVPDASLITPPVVVVAADHRLTFAADLDAGVGLDFVASRYHSVDITHRNGRYRIALAEADVPADHDLELIWKPVAGRAPRAMLFSETVDGAAHALLMLLPPGEVAAPPQVAPRDLVLVVDTSGSMHGTSLDQAKRALGLALSGLTPADRFNVIEFNSTTSSLFAESVTATPANVGIAGRYVSGLAANGGTEMLPALARALDAPLLETHLRQIIFVTDGSVGNEEALFALIEDRIGASRLFTVGIGSAPNSWFMRKAAESGRGTFTMISALHEVSEKMERLFRKIETPQVTDLTVEWPGGSNTQSYPAIVPDLYAGEPVVVSARLAGAARSGDLVKVSGNSTPGRWEAQLPLRTGESREGIGALWARARIEDLLDRQRRGAAGDLTRAAVVETALAHHLVSKYTSLVAIDKTPARTARAGLDREHVASLLPHGQSAAAIFGFPATATGAAAARLTGLALLLAGLFTSMLMRRRRACHGSVRPF